jgi:hypothetical protein
MLDAVVDRREMKDVITRVLRFGRPEPAVRPASAAEASDKKVPLLAEAASDQ